MPAPIPNVDQPANQGTQPPATQADEPEPDDSISSGSSGESNKTDAEDNSDSTTVISETSFESDAESDLVSDWPW